MNPIDLLRLCNVDMAAKEPIESALKLFGELLDEMEEMLELWYSKKINIKNAI